MVCSKLIGRSYFKSYSELFLGLCIARELGRRGMSLDLRDMTIDPDMVRDSLKDYLRWLMQEGYVVLDASKPSGNLEPPSIEVNTEIFDKLYSEGKLMGTGVCKGVGGIAVSNNVWWTRSFADKNWGNENSDLLNLTKVHTTLMHLVAYWLLKRVLDKVPDKFSIVIDSSVVRNTFIYTNLYSIQLTLQNIDEVFDLDVDFGMYEVDIEYSIFCNNGILAGRYKFWSVDEKKKWMEKCGMVPGAIIVLWSRKGVCDSNKIGKIDTAITARIDEIGKDFVALTTMAINKTREEMIDDYYEIDECNRYLFTDLLEKRPYLHSEVINLCELGIDNYMYKESRFLTLIDTSHLAKTQKKITIDGNSDYVEMSEVDAIYWVLRQFDIDFNAELYRKMYSGGKDLLWDLYGTIV